MNDEQETIVTSAFRAHRSQFSYSLAAALPEDILSSLVVVVMSFH
jgi:hypothetical protein